MSYIQVDHLQKNFWVRKKKDKRSLFREKEKVEALRDLSFQIERGELVGYIGPNGAGKSSTVKILSGILTPDSGSATIGGLIPWENRKEHVRRIGVVFGQRMQLWWDVPILDSFSLLKDIYRIPDAAWKKRLDELSGALQLEDLMRTPLRLLSLGQRMRAELCGSLLHQPELLFLDEPSIGLDSISKLALRDFLRWENREHGTTILLTDHRLEEEVPPESLVVVMDKGAILSEGTPQQVGLSLKDKGHSMFLAMPTAMRVWAAVENDAECPVTVREGRDWLTEYTAAHPLSELPPEPV